jgi:glyoxylase-like metal-dependent hydrolase (beta-lactamase superfamily II)
MRKPNVAPWNSLRTLRTAALGFALVAAGCDSVEEGAGPPGAQGPQGPQGSQGPKGDPGTSAVVDPALSPVEKAFAGIGGKAAIQALQGFELEITGQRHIQGEGYTPDADPLLAHTFDGTRVRYDVKNNRLAIHHKRTLKVFGFNSVQDYVERINGNLGHVDGTESLFGAPGGNLLSDRTAAIRRQQKLLNPHLILQEIATTPALASDGGMALLDGSLHHVVVVNDPVYPLSLYVNAQTGKLSKLVTLENDHLHRDIPVEVHYAGWQATAANGLLFPRSVFIGVNGHLLHSETRKSVAVNPTLDAALFAFPASASPTYVEADASRGLANHQFHMTFASIGIPIDGLQTEVSGQQMAEGVYFLGGSHNSVAIEQANGIVILEAPLNPERSTAIINWVKAQAHFDGKPITHVFATHHHDDHSAGLRAFVAAGASVVVHESAAPFFRTIFRNPSTIRKDPLAEKPAAANIITVPAGGMFKLDDAANPVAAYSLETVHAKDMLLFYLGGQKVAFSSDLYNPGVGGIGNGPKELYKAITQTHKLDVAQVAGGHGGIQPISDLAALANP